MTARDEKILETVKKLTVRIDDGEEFSFSMDGFNPNIHQVLSFYIGHVISHRLEADVKSDRMRDSPLLNQIGPGGTCHYLIENTDTRMYKNYDKLTLSFYKEKNYENVTVQFDTKLNMTIDLDILSRMQYDAWNNSKNNKK